MNHYILSLQNLQIYRAVYKIKKSIAYICGDYNIDLLKIQEKHQYNDFFDNIMSLGFHPENKFTYTAGE